MNEHRRNLRKRAHQAIPVTDTISGQPIGHIGNLSTDGMLLISSRRLPDNALFQFSFNLPGAASRQAKSIEIGVNEQWGEAANVPGQFWSGFRIIDISPDDYTVLCDWVAIPGNQSD
ncbi:MAG: PilZ domain-containing protein [Rudaea sp.]